MTIEELKQKIIEKSIEPSLYTAKNEDGKDIIVYIDTDSLTIETPQKTRFNLLQIYDYDRDSNQWTYSETYEYKGLDGSRERELL